MIHRVWLLRFLKDEYYLSLSRSHLTLTCTRARVHEQPTSVIHASVLLLLQIIYIQTSVYAYPILSKWVW